MADSKVYILYPNDKISYKYKNDISKFDVPDSEKPPEYSALGMTKDFIKTGEKILSNLTISSKNLRIYHYINKNTNQMINDFSINDFQEIKPFLEDLNKKYNFPELKEDEAIQFAERLAIFNLLFSYHRNLALICDSSAKDLKKELFIEDIMKPRIKNLNEIGNMLFESPIQVDEDELLKCENKKEIKSYLLSYHNDLLKAVNEFTHTIGYSISSYIDIKRKVTCPITNEIFHLIWYIFISYVICTVKPSKIGFCIYCGRVTKYSTKSRKKCDKCTNKGRKNKK